MEVALIKLLDFSSKQVLIVLSVRFYKERCKEYFEWAKKVVDNLRGTNKYPKNALDELFKKHNLI